MKKTFFMLLFAASTIAVSALTAWGVSSLNNKQQTARHHSDSEPDSASFHFANSNSSNDGSLPGFTEAAETAVGAVVNIENIRTVAVNAYGNGGNFIDPFEFFFGPQQGQPQQRQQQPQTRESRSGGSGVIISTDGYIVTNNHVINDADKIIVTLSDSRTFTATLVGTDPSTDIALVKIDAQNLPTLAFGDSEKLRLGQWVLAIGNPMGLNSTVTAGIISAKGRSLGSAGNGPLDIQSFIQTDAVVNPGNSGGALVTTDGLLIGINTILKSNTGTYIGYSFAVPSSIVRKVVSDIKEFGTVQRAVLGIKYSEISPAWIEQFAKELKITETEGLYVGEVIEDGAAKEAGIKKGDIIIAVNDTPTRTSAALQETLAKLRPGDKINISIKRDGALKHFDITLRNRAGKAELISKDAVDIVKMLGGQFKEPSAQTLKKLGIKSGIQIVEITPNGLLAKSRVRTGFIITHINSREISSVNDLNRMTEKIESIDGIYPDGKQVMYQVINN